MGRNLKLRIVLVNDVTLLFTWRYIIAEFVMLLSFDGVLKKLFIICENNRKSNKIMHCVDFLER